MGTVQTDESNEAENNVTEKEQTPEDTEQATTEKSTTEDTEQPSATTTDSDDSEQAPLTFTSEQILSAQADEDTYVELDSPAKDAKGRTSVFPGLFALVGAALGFVSISGTWLGTLVSNRLAVLGQIQAQSGGTNNPIAAIYSGPWHATALVNGAFALVAVIITGLLLLRDRVSSLPAPWIRAVTGAGLVLGVLGVIIAAVMYSDVFTALPKLPASGG
jgi:hypothetical protein